MSSSRFRYPLVLLLACYLIGMQKLRAQEKTKYFQLSSTSKKPVKSFYNKVKFIDSREDTTNYGIVRVGALNKEAMLVPPISMGEQLNQVLFENKVEGGGNRELFFQLRKLKFIEKAEGLKEFGYCFFRANVYTLTHQGYVLMSAIDTLLAVESRDVTKPIMDRANKTIIRFFLESVKKDSVGSQFFTMDQIVNIDEVEKQNFKLYTATEFADGIYSTFQYFRDQTPDLTLFSITFEDGEISEIKARNRSGKLVKMKSENVYAIVNKGIPYISAQFGYYPLVKNNNDFYFIGDDKQHYLKGHVVRSNSLLKPMEFVYSNISLTSQYEIKIDHLNGKFMRVKEIKDGE